MTSNIESLSHFKACFLLKVLAGDYIKTFANEIRSQFPNPINLIKAIKAIIPCGGGGDKKKEKRFAVGVRRGGGRRGGVM